MPKQKPKHILQRIPLEMLHEILSYLQVKDFVRLAQVSRWMYSVVSPLRFNYLVLSIKRITEPSSDLYRKKIFIFTEQTCTYTQLRKKLTLEAPHKNEWLRAVETIKQQNSVSLDTSMDAMKAIAGIVFVSCLPVMTGAALDRAKIDISSYLFGLSGFQVGYGLTMTGLSSFCAWMLKVVSESNHDIDYQSIQLILEDSVSLKLTRGGS